MKRTSMTMIGLLLMAGLFTARAQNQQVHFAIDPGLTNVTAGSASNNVGAAAFSIPQNTDLIVQPRISGAAAGTNGQTTFGLNLAVYTNFSTTLPLSYTMTNNGATPCVGYWWISRTNLTGCGWGRVDAISTSQTNTVQIIGIDAGYRQP